MSNTKTNSISFVGRNPYLEGAPAREAARKAVEVLNNTFYNVERIGGKQLYKVDDAFYILIVSAPSSLKLDSSIRGLMKSYGKLPFYVLFTRETSDYPPASFDIYYAKIRKIYKFRGAFRGCILGLSELKKDWILDSLSEVQPIPLGLARYKDNGGGVSVESVLKELGLKPAAIREGKKLLRLIDNYKQ